jgi:hypothetical protein
MRQPSGKINSSRAKNRACTKVLKPLGNLHRQHAQNETMRRYAAGPGS